MLVGRAEGSPVSHRILASSSYCNIKVMLDYYQVFMRADKIFV